MRNSFDYYKQVDKPNMYLCNPDQKPIAAINADNRHLILRFNDLSELSFTVHKVGGVETVYQRIETKRLIFVEKIGWFQIISSTEKIEGNNIFKEVIAESHQTQFKNKGFVVEDRVHMFYNPNDPQDKLYDSTNKEAIPSVIGQLCQQTGLKINLQSNDIEANEDFIDWTLIYIEPELKFKAKSYDSLYVQEENSNNICRTFAENTTVGYDFIKNSVESAFEVIFIFDFLYHSIKVKSIENITTPTNIYFSLGNLINSLNITEKAENIVTVLSCNGNDLDIRTVNPMGTNFIVDFSYYKKRQNDDETIPFPWMSEQLIDTLDAWELEWIAWQSDDVDRIGHSKGYSTIVKELQELFSVQVKSDEQVQYANLKLTDLQVARDLYINKEKKALDGAGLVSVERVKVDNNSLLLSSAFFNETFNPNTEILAYDKQPLASKKDVETKSVYYEFIFDGDGIPVSIETMLQNFIGKEKDENGNWLEDENSTTPLYFTDDSAKKSYCKIEISSEVGVVTDENGNIASDGNVEVGGIKFNIISSTDYFIVTLPNASSLNVNKAYAYFAYNEIRYKITQSADRITSVHYFYVSGFERLSTYQALVGDVGWCSIWENYISILTAERKNIQSEIDALNDELSYINDKCDVQKYIKRTGDNIYNEFSNYWIEGNYDNSNLAAQSTTTMADRINLAKELMDAGKKELEKASQPTFEMSVDVINFLKIIKFKPFIDELELGKVITIEKDANTFYRPALVGIEYDLDISDTFSLSFSTAAKLDETSMTYADLINESSSTSRTVTSNWSNLTDYWKNKDEITSLINFPLDRALHSANANMANQQFTIDTTGILGRKWSDDSRTSFSPNQVRLINNVLLFTDNSWETSKLALGEVYYFEEGLEKRAYGILADVLIGSLIMGERLKIVNDKNTISLNDSGISIKNASKDLVFLASTSGNVYIKGEIFATKLTLADGVTIQYNAISDAPDMSGFVTIENGYMQTGDYKYTSGSYASAGMKIDFINQYIRTKNFAVDSNGQLNSRSGEIGGFTILNNKMYSGTVGISSDIVVGAYSFWAGNVEPDKAPFSVNNKGTIIANSGNVAGLMMEQGVDIQGDKTNPYKTLKTADGSFIIKVSEHDGSSITIDRIQSSSAGRAIELTKINCASGKFGYISVGDLIFENTTIKTLNTRINMDYQPYAPVVTATISNSWSNQTITLNLSEALPIAKSFEINYHVTWGSWASTIITVPIGSTKGSVTVNAFLGVDDAQFIATGSKSYSFTSEIGSCIDMMGNVTPWSNKQYDLGSVDYRWRTLFADGINSNSSPIITSDVNKKNSIENIGQRYGDVFDLLRPVIFKYNNGSSDRIHIGLIANEVKTALDLLHIDTRNFAPYCSWEDDNGNITCGIRYEELISLNISEIQKLKKRISTLENEIKELRGTI